MNDEKVTLHIPTFKILLGLGIISTIVGILAPIQLIEIFDFKLWFDPGLSVICLPLGVGLICGYITRKILPSMKEAYWIGFLLGIIGLIIAICMKSSNNNNNDKYEELHKLTELKQSGILTEEEFNIEKDKLLK